MPARLHHCVHTKFSSDASLTRDFDASRHNKLDGLPDLSMRCAVQCHVTLRWLLSLGAGVSEYSNLTGRCQCRLQAHTSHGYHIYHRPCHVLHYLLRTFRLLMGLEGTRSANCLPFGETGEPSYQRSCNVLMTSFWTDLTGSEAPGDLLHCLL